MSKRRPDLDGIRNRLNALGLVYTAEQLERSLSHGGAPVRGPWLQLRIHHWRTDHILGCGHGRYTPRLVSQLLLPDHLDGPLAELN